MRVAERTPCRMSPISPIIVCNARPGSRRREIEREVDPLCANRSYYLITGETSAAVQGAINGLVAEVESFASGHGTFIGPRRGRNGRYFAIGETIVNVEEGL